MKYPKQPGQDAEAHRRLAVRVLTLSRENEELRRSKVAGWISTRDHLPRNFELVLILDTVRNCRGYDDEPRHIHVAQFVRGKTAAEVEASGAWGAHDVGCNNLVPYNWECDGPLSYFGQDVSHWMPLPEGWKGVGPENDEPRTVFHRRGPA